MLVSRETRKRRSGYADQYPQAEDAFYVAFHVKLGGLWITSVDNFGVLHMARRG